MKRVLITGYSGLVGYDVATVLADAGFELILAGRTEYSFGNSSFVYNNLSSGVFCWNPELPKPDVVVHMAASLLIGNNAEEQEQLQTQNVDFTRDLMRWCEASGIPKFVFISSLSLLKKPLPHSIDEASAVDPILPYSISKKVIEDELLQGNESDGMKSIVFRISSPLSSRRDALPKNVIGRWISLAEQGKSIQLFGSGSRTQDFVWTGDIASAILLAIEKEFSGLFHIASSMPVSMLEMASVVAQEFGVTLERGGADANEHERWNLDTSKAFRTFGYQATKSGVDILEDLIRNRRQS